MDRVEHKHFVNIDLQENPVAANCDVCGKGPELRSQHLALPPAHQAPLEPQHPERSDARERCDSKRINVCTSCIKAGKVVR